MSRFSVFLREGERERERAMRYVIAVEFLLRERRRRREVKAVKQRGGGGGRGEV